MTRRSHTGFTLIELIVAMGILLVLVNAGLPEVRAWVERTRIEAEIDRFLSLIQIARTTAITHNTRVILCPGQSASAPAVCARRNTWHQGAVAFIDHDGNRELNDEDIVVAEQDATERLRIYWRAFRNRGYLRFTGRGVTDWQNGHFLFCPVPSRATHARQIVLNYAGRTYRSRDSNGDGVHEDVRGRPLVCPTS